MALLFPWATKEYLLWEMSLGQLVMYHNIGLDQKYPSPDSGKPSVKNMSRDELRAAREEARRLMSESEVEESDRKKQAFRDKYGAV